ncbi:MAG: DUF547 domain-containing protein [Bacteroidota bacterium]
MKKLIFSSLLLVAISTVVMAQGEINSFIDGADRFLRANVKDGRVDYQKIINDQSVLDRLTDQIANADLSGISGTERKAFYINAYNILVINSVVQAYPTNSPQSVAGFFDSKKHTVAGERFTLNQLEKERLLNETGDERLHFVLVCAALGCPIIENFAYQPETLNSQLQAQSRKALNDPNFIRVNRADQKVEVSQIFEWYKSDFTKNGQTIIEFLNTYRTDAIPSNYKVGYYNYDWTLNAAQPTASGSTQAVNVVDGASSNLTTFTPSALFAKGQYEINFFNSLYSQNSIRNATGDEIGTATRVSILNSMLQFTYGSSENRRVNLGFDVMLSAGSNGPADGSHFQLFGSDATSRALAISGIGPRIKVAPFKKFPFYSIQTSFLLPVTGNLERRGSNNSVFTALNRYTWRTQFFYDFKLTQKLRLFYEFDVIYLIRRNRDEIFFPTNFVDLPSIVFLNYFPSSKLSLFLNGQYTGRYGNTGIPSEDPNAKFGLLQWFIQVGGGARYQINDHIGLELSYNNFVGSRGFQGIEAGAGETVNFGLRFIR